MIIQLSHSIISRATAAATSSEDDVNEQLLYAGSWSYGAGEDQCGFPLCPATGREFTDKLPHRYTWSLGHGQAEYLPPEGLRLYSLRHSFNRILKVLASPVNITFLGDSLSSQKWYAAECMSEIQGLPGRYQHIHTRWFVDNPCGCHHSNNTDTSYTHNNYPRCAWKESFAEWELDSSTNILVVNNGAWFSKFWLGCMSERGVEDSYANALRFIRPFLERCIQSGMVVVWFCLPYSTSARAEVGYHNFKERNDVARVVFEGSGVIVVDPFELVRERVQRDPRVKCDDLHFCGFGPSSIPVFEFQLIMHFASHSFHPDH